MTQYPLPITVISGLTDTGLIKTVAQPNNEIKIVVPGTASFAHVLPSQYFKVYPLLLNNQIEPQSLQIPNHMFVNHIADPDSCSIALQKAIKLTQDLKRPCFNHPIHVLRTRRDFLAELLKDIPNVRVPRTIRVTPKLPTDFLKTAKQHDLQYPIVVRLAGDQGGVSTVLVENAKAWNKVHALPWGGRTLYFSEFVDYKDSDGHFRKHRLAIVDGQPSLRHLVISKEWMLHRNTTHTEAAHAEEQAVLKRFDTETLPTLQPTLKAIHERIGLEYFGIDCHLSQEGEITVFEANATMYMVQNTRPSPNCWDAPCQKIAQRLYNALAKRALIVNQKTKEAAMA